MEEKIPANKDVPEENSTEVSEGVESDELLSESADMTDNTDSANESSAQVEKKPETSQMQSDNTSGIEIVSTSTTSASEIIREEAEGATALDAEAISEPLPVETEMVTSASEITCEGVDNSDAEEKTKPSSIQTEPADELSKSITSTTEIQSENVESSSAVENPGPLPIESETTSGSEMASHIKTSGSEVPCDKDSSDAVKEKCGEIASTETSPKARKSLIEKVKGIFSPTKSKKSKSRSKSMSPSDKNKVTAGGDSCAASEVRTSNEGEGNVKNESEKTGIFTMKNLKGRLRKLSVKMKSSGSETTNLVTNEAIERSEEPDASKSKMDVETKGDLEQCMSNMPRWTNNRTSLVEVPSLGGTTMTDVPSTSSSSVISDASSRKPSTVGENALEEAVASSLLNSSDAEIADIKDYKNAENEHLKDSPSDEGKQEAAATNIDQQQSSEEILKNPDSKYDSKLEKEN